MDIEQKMAEGKGRGYERWAKIHNLKQAAKTLSVYQQYGFTSPEQLEAAVDTAYQKMRQTSGDTRSRVGNEAAREKEVAAAGVGPTPRPRPPATGCGHRNPRKPAPHTGRPMRAILS